MENKPKYTEQDLDNLIRERMKDCDGLPQVCAFLQNEEGRRRIMKRVKELIFIGQVHDVDACLASIESELDFDIQED